MNLTRRNFLGSAVGVLGVGLLEGCKEKLPRYLVPYSAPPDDVIPGLARNYRTVCRECPAGCGATVRVREGRAVKMEGSPEHPVSLGALCPGGHAAIERLYAPTRLGAPVAGGKEIGWDQAQTALADGLGRALAAGQRVVVLTRPERGLLRALFGSWLTALGQPASQVVTFDPMERWWLREGQRRAFGTAATPTHDFAAAKLLLSIGDDFVEEGSPVEAARQLGEHRAAGGRSVYVGPRLSLTAASADEWLSVEPGTELIFVLGLIRQVLDLVGPQATPARPGLDGQRARVAPYDDATVAARCKLSRGSVTELARSLATARPSLVVGPGRAVAGGDGNRRSRRPRSCRRTILAYTCRSPPIAGNRAAPDRAAL